LGYAGSREITIGNDDFIAVAHFHENFDKFW
jgi:hypothetical protein